MRASHGGHLGYFRVCVREARSLCLAPALRDKDAIWSPLSSSETRGCAGNHLIKLNYFMNHSFPQKNRSIHVQMPGNTVRKTNFVEFCQDFEGPPKQSSLRFKNVRHTPTRKGLLLATASLNRMMDVGRSWLGNNPRRALVHFLLSQRQRLLGSLTGGWVIVGQRRLHVGKSRRPSRSFY